MLLSLQEYKNRQAMKEKGTYRIMCLGESTTQGQYPPFLEEILNQHDISLNFCVIEKGLIGTNTSAILTHLESNLDRYNPDIVITMMGINDTETPLLHETITTSKILLIFRSSRTYKLGRLLWLHILDKAKEKRLYKSPKRRNSEQPKLHIIGMTEGQNKKTIGSNHQEDTAYLGLGEFYRKQGNLLRAEEAFKKAIELNPKNDKVYVDLGWVYLSLGTSYMYKAEEAFKKAIELNPKNDKVYVDLGWVYHKQGNILQAEESFKKTIEINSHAANKAYAGLGKLYHKQGNILQAEESFKKAIELNPQDYTLYFELGWLYEVQNNLLQAEESFKKAIELNPESDRIYAALSLLYAKMEKTELAKECDKKANALRLTYYNPLTVSNYHKLKEILDERHIKLVCVQYPMRRIESLKKIFEGQDEVIFVDNEKIFKEALKQASYSDYFIDAFGGDFGHCTNKGNRLLAENIAKTILRECLHK